MSIAIRRLSMLGFLVAGFVVGCRVTDLPLWDVPRSHSHAPYQVREDLAVAYFKGPGADNHRHRLDLYVPKDREDSPVVVLVHGGAWLVGDNRCCGLYSSIGRFFASQGVAVVIPNYRLSPDVQHPEHVKDVARAIAWTKAHIPSYGGDPKKLFLLGHSAGGHLVSLLATDDQYLKAQNLKTADLCGVIAVSGVYHITAGSLKVTLGGEGPLAFRLDKMSPLRGDNLPQWAHLGCGPGIPITANIFGPAFGDDPRARELASPTTHVRPGLPPFLLISADNDLPVLNDMAKEFHAALSRASGQVQDVRDEQIRGGRAGYPEKNRLIRVANRNHNSIMFRAIEPSDPVAREILDFVEPKLSATGEVRE